MAENSKKSSGFSYYIKIAGPLLIICAVVALMLSAVNLLTRDTIAANTAEARRQAVMTIFPGMGEDGSYTEISGDYGKKVGGVYSVKNAAGSFLGWCVNISSVGNDGDIELMIGYDGERAITGVSIVSSSETKQLPAGFTDRFAGRVGKLSYGTDGLDAVANVTISSKAVLAGINEATAIIEELSEGAAE